MGARGQGPIGMGKGHPGHTVRPPATVAIGGAPTASAWGGRGGAGGAGAPPPAKVSIGQADINPVDPDQLHMGGELKWPVIDFPAQFNELQGDATSGDIPPITRSMMPTPSLEKAD